MEYLLKGSILFLLFGGIILIFFRNKFDIERRMSTFNFLPLVIAVMMIELEKGFTLDNLYIFVFSLILGLLLIRVTLKVVGYQFQVLAEKKDIIRVVRTIKGFQRSKDSETGNKMVYSNGSQKIRIYDYASKGFTVSADRRLLHRNDYINTLITGLISIDMRKTGKREGITYLIIGSVMMTAYQLIHFVF